MTAQTVVHVVSMSRIIIELRVTLRLNSNNNRAVGLSNYCFRSSMVALVRFRVLAALCILHVLICSVSSSEENLVSLDVSSTGAVAELGEGDQTIFTQRFVTQPDI